MTIEEIMKAVGIAVLILLFVPVFWLVSAGLLYGSFYLFDLDQLCGNISFWQSCGIVWLWALFHAKVNNR